MPARQICAYDDLPIFCLSIFCLSTILVMILLSFLSWMLFLILSLLPMASKVHFGVDVFFYFGGSLGHLDIESC